jgi:hypothetical protein
MSTKLKILSLRKKLTPILPNNNCISLVPYGTNFSSTIGLNLNSVHRNIIILTPFLEQVLIGLILGDGNLQLTQVKINPFFNLIKELKI